MIGRAFMFSFKGNRKNPRSNQKQNTVILVSTASCMTPPYEICGCADYIVVLIILETWKYMIV